MKNSLYILGLHRPKSAGDFVLFVPLSGCCVTPSVNTVLPSLKFSFLNTAWHSGWGVFIFYVDKVLKEFLQTQGTFEWYPILLLALFCFRFFFMIKINFVAWTSIRTCSKNVNSPYFSSCFCFFFLSDLKRIQNNTWIHVIDCCDNLNWSWCD